MRKFDLQANVLKVCLNQDEFFLFWMFFNDDEHRRKLPPNSGGGSWPFPFPPLSSLPLPSPPLPSLPSLPLSLEVGPPKSS